MNSQDEDKKFQIVVHCSPLEGFSVENPMKTDRFESESIKVSCIYELLQFIEGKQREESWTSSS
jgi:hypothetical protein